MNDIAVFKNAGLPVGDLMQFQKALANAQANVAVKSGEDFLKLSKHDGSWIYGADETEVQEGSHWAINPASLRMGFISWGKGEVLGKKLLPILTGQMVDRNTLPNTGAAWDDCVAFQLRCMNGEDEGTQVEYEQNSYGAKKAFLNLIEAIQLQITRDTVNIVPVVTLKSDSYQHKMYGLIYNPIFEIVKWISMGGVAVDAEVEEETQGQQPAQAAAAPAAAPPPAQKPKRAKVGEAAPAAPAAAAPATAPDPKPAVVRQRRRPVAAS